MLNSKQFPTRYQADEFFYDFAHNDAGVRKFTSFNAEAFALIVYRQAHSTTVSVVSHTGVSVWSETSANDPFIRMIDGERTPRELYETGYAILRWMEAHTMCPAKWLPEFDVVPSSHWNSVHEFHRYDPPNVAGTISQETK